MRCNRHEFRGGGESGLRVDWPFESCASFYRVGHTPACFATTLAVSLG
jgi:hypothetical protein